MLTLAFRRAIGFVILYFTTECLTMTIRYRDNETIGKKIVDSGQTNIQICGSQLTSLITSLCDGYLSSPTDDYPNPNGTRDIALDHSGVVEKCCKNPCNREFLLQHCAEKSKLKAILQPKWEVPDTTNDVDNFINKSENPSSKAEMELSGRGVSAEMRLSDIPKVRLREGNEKGRRKNRKNFKKGLKKRKSLFKWDCPYKSFGHYLLTMDRNVNVPNKIRKRKNVQPQEVGTIKPDFLGGEPFIVGSRHGSSRKISVNFISRAKSIVSRY